VDLPDGGPQEAARWRTRIDYQARDDYGVESVTARITNPKDTQTAPLEFPLSLPANGGNVFVHSSIHALSSHIWAGDEIKIVLIAKDHLGQTTESDDHGGKLPLRVFKHPVSKELASWRKDLARRPAATIPKALESVSKILANRTSFGGEPVVTLTLQ